ncbi:hypothetical protein LTR91_014425 [Friedmanniomyces endolithicus]|uniref:Uncharacterized protein n=1 Tax=Friedmanniomyces endolithicus TaxID=329885 RepID=A0AAN6KBZ6_9PEZI|nr:hypothetical protein LTR94_018637 [Friedmanniomyces endolithicus]KAK0775416.1 hypothetical protein LTR59_014533 [Friedmanniomyces endolithicus]KAK0779783.1 hypothetical protein LTR38_014299 [Friedmanniomyces endolithicus]KAK0782890.1 hypothetical protein LTR75_014274 [Friedmanniomyces endolithicus]KAK0831860.1 hypothetical protein LTR03_015400 [Friedmanniomyces endolithicus]
MADSADIASLANEITRVDIADSEGETAGTNIIGAEVESRSTSIVVSEGDVTSMNILKSGGDAPSTNIVDIEGKITTTNITDTEARPFEFFRLPRELRDSIYDLMIQDVPVKVYDSIGTICEPPISYMTVCNAPYIQPLILNKQFSNEYRQRIDKVMVLQLKYVSHTQFGEPNYLEDPLPSIKSVKLDLTLNWEVDSSVDWTYSLHYNQQWLHTVLKRVRDAENITVRMSVRARQHETAQQWQEWRDAPRNCTALDSFVQALAPSTLALYSRDEDIDDEGVRGPKTEQLRQTWTAEGGWKNEDVGEGGDGKAGEEGDSTGQLETA